VDGAVRDPQQDAPRVRDLPAPRRNRSAAGGTIQRSMAWPYRAILAFLLWTRIRPWQLTLLSLVLNVASGALILYGDWFAAGIVLLLAGMADVFDGAVARQRGTEGRSGAFMDSVLDRVSDMILFSTLFWVLAERGDTTYAALALVTLVVSLLVSHIRAEAEAAGLTLTEGIFQRLERVLALMAGLVIPGAMRPVLVVLAALGGVTVAQRLWSVVRRLA
jgi:CDP-diacylglycerol--glycerol-3-phosphate 3-phosphatidyltransferase